jgi:predicted metal-dependent phosphoesterase TrpH
MQVLMRAVLKCAVFFFVILTLSIIVNCGGGGGGGSAAAPLPQSVTIQVFCGRGVQGNTPGVYSQKKSSVFNYAFSLSDGYKDLQVRMDGDLVPSSGSPVVAGDVAIIATAVPLSELPRFKTNTHTHTTQSDGSLSPEGIVSQYHNRHYDVLFLTDHNKVTDVDSPEGMLVIPGEELTQAAHHANALFATKTIDPGNRQPSDYLQEVIDSGAVPLLNHPVWLVGWTLQDIFPLNGVKLIEIYNASCESKGFHDNLTLWDSLLSLGKLWYGVASDDAHYQNDIGKAWIMVQADGLDLAGIRKGIEDGSFYASTGIELCRTDFADGVVYIESRNGESIDFIGNNGDLLLRVAGPFGQYRAKDADGYVRAVVTGKNNAKAWTQPLFWGFTP